jgi:hypothetical protein
MHRPKPRKHGVLKPLSSVAEPLNFGLLDNYDDSEFPVINIGGNKGDFLLWHSFRERASVLPLLLIRVCFSPHLTPLLCSNSG